MIKIKYLLLLFLFIGNVAVQAQEINEVEYFKEDFPKATYNKRLEAEKLFEQGKRDYENGDYVSSIEYLKESINLMPDHVMAYFYRAGAKEQTNDIKGALTDYGIVVHFDTEFNEALFNRGMLRYKIADFSGAVEDFTKLLTLPSQNTQTVYFKGNSYGTDGPGATSIISMYSKDADIYNYLGLSKTKLGKVQEAIKDFNKALAINNTDANYFVNRGMAYLSDNQTAMAHDDFKKAIALEPDQAVAMFNLSMSSNFSKKDQKIYDEIIAKNEAFPSAYINRGLIKFKAANYADAVEDYNSAIKLDPSNAIAFLNRALAYEKLEKYQEAVEDLNKALKIDPYFHKAYSSRGNVYFKLKDYERALMDYNQVILAEENDVSLFYNRALVKYKLKLKDEACQDLHHAISNGFIAAQKALDAYCR
ncbi:MAG: tetratricopeptide repeat protein [Bacteroidota bacterium]|nr:tetratricopeptide repeat protein [Bacteroidota bacterium]